MLYSYCIRSINTHRKSKMNPLHKPLRKRLLSISPKGEDQVRETCGELSQWNVCTVLTLDEAAKVLEKQRFHLGVLVNCIEKNKILELESFLGRHTNTQWVGVIDETALQERACRMVMANHLCDYHTIPVNHEKLQHTLGHVLGWAALRDEPAPGARSVKPGQLTGNSPAITRLRTQIERVAAVSAPVLVCGESGSGKELIAKAVHEKSARASGPFVAINCGAIPCNLIQSELFGHEKGAFTGAGKEKMGLIESAQNGTIFLDEIAEMPMELQVSLLRFLQEKTIFRVGSTKSIVVNARVIAASHVDLQTAVSKGLFREDLYYRMNVLPITVPPLRDRIGDLPLLVAEFFHAFSGEKNAQLRGVSRAAMDAMLNYSWPGNVRELMNRMRRAMVLAEGRMISADDLGLGEATVQIATEALTASRAGAEKNAIITCLARASGNVSQAARDLKVSRMTLYRLMEKHRITNTSIVHAAIIPTSPPYHH
jgi:DNA-binding NtrC family response regulator